MTIVNYIHDSISGSIFTLSDLQLELEKYENVKTHNYFFKLSNDVGWEKLFNIKKAIDDWTFISYSYGNKPINDDIVITSYYFLYHSDYSKISGKTLLVLDSLDFYLDDNVEDKLKTISKNFNKVYLLFNPFNIENLKKYNIEQYKNIKAEEYFSKISKTRVDKMILLSKKDERVLLRSEDINNKYNNSFLYNNRYEFLNPLNFSKFAFSRIQTNGIYLENIGKIFFEYLYANKPVDYYPYRKCMDDGLTHYMNLLGLDDSKILKNIKISKETLMGKIFFNENDLILKIIKEGK